MDVSPAHVAPPLTSLQRMSRRWMSLRGKQWPLPASVTMAQPDDVVTTPTILRTLFSCFSKAARVISLEASSAFFVAGQVMRHLPVQGPRVLPTTSFVERVVKRSRTSQTVFVTSAWFQTEAALHDESVVVIDLLLTGNGMRASVAAFCRINKQIVLVCFVVLLIMERNDVLIN